MYNARFGLVLSTCRVPKSCVSFAYLDVLCNEHSDGVRYVSVYVFVNEFIYVHTIKCLCQVLLCLMLILSGPVELLILLYSV